MNFPFFQDMFSYYFKGFYYTVQENETVEIISKRYKIPVNNIIMYNRLTYPYAIKEGDRLFIPGIDEPISPNCSIYTVKFGDSIDSIAKKFNISSEEIMLKNYITNKNTIFIGQKLLLPVSSLEVQTSKIQKEDNNEIRIYPIEELRNRDRANTARMANFQAKLPVIRKGHRGEDVIKLKRLISAIGYKIKRFDDAFDSSLENEIKRLQREAGMIENGIVDANVWEYIFGYINDLPASSK